MSQSKPREEDLEIIAAMSSNLESVCGEQAPYSDYRPGEWIQYRIGPEVRTGLILFVTQAHMLGSQHIPLTYLCAPAGAGDTWPDYIYCDDIIVGGLDD